VVGSESDVQEESLVLSDIVDLNELEEVLETMECYKPRI
jgi:hypothetical protein